MEPHFEFGPGAGGGKGAQGGGVWWPCGRGGPLVWARGQGRGLGSYLGGGLGQRLVWWLGRRLRGWVELWRSGGA